MLAELALTVTSLAGAGLAIHSFWNRTQVDLGVQTENILTFSLPVTQEKLNTRSGANPTRREVPRVEGHVRVANRSSVGIRREAAAL